MANDKKKRNEKNEGKKDFGEKNDSSRRIADLGKMAKETYENIPKELIQKYKDTVKRHSEFIKKRDESLNQLSETLREKWRKPVAKKTEKKKKSTILDNPGNPDEGELPVLEQCESEFDTTTLSLTNRRAKFMQHFYKLLIFNHPFKESFVKYNWFIGQVLRYKQEWRPAGFGLGELIKSFSLLPLEETTIEATVWEKTKSEIESIEEDDVRKAEEESSKSLDSSEVTKETSEKSGWHVEASGSIGFGIGSASLTAGAEGSSESHAKQMKSAVNEKAKSSSSAISQKRSVKVGFATEAGRENKTVRILKNTNRCHTVTFNFFQLLKIYDLIMTYEDAPLALLFPNARKHLSNTTIMEMYQRMHKAFTDFSSPFSFITQYFRIDPELGKALGYGSSDPGEQSDLSGTALVLTTKPDPARPEKFVEQVIEGLTYFFGFIVGDDLIPYEINTLSEIVRNYIENDIAMREDDEKEVIDSLEILTQGIYVDSMLGKCSACESYIQYSRLYDVMLDREKARKQRIQNALDEKEVERRVKLIESDILDPFVHEKPKENDDQPDTNIDG